MTGKDSDRDVLEPRANAALVGQEAAERAFLRARASGRMPHAWLIAGRGGVGKATLAFRLARFLFADGRTDAASLAVSASHPVFHRVAAGGHADLLTIERRFDEEKGRRRKEIAVEDVRRIAPFLRLTAAEGGWRVVIVDDADRMNRSGQNAILKILEEPPKESLLLLLSERPSTLLPTIRSRCRLLTLPPLPDAVVDGLIAERRPDLDSITKVRLTALAAGSIGRALDIAEHDGLTLLTQFLAIAVAEPVDWAAAHAFAEKLGPAAADESFRSFAQLLVDWLSRIARELGEGKAGRQGVEFVAGERELVARLGAARRLEQAMEVWEKVSHLFIRAESANLDRRLTVISALDTVSAALR